MAAVHLPICRVRFWPKADSNVAALEIARIKAVSRAALLKPLTTAQKPPRPPAAPPRP